jgi:hypothetical protein
MWIILVATVVVANEVLALNTTCNVHVQEELEYYRVEDSLRFLSWSVFFDEGR